MDAASRGHHRKTRCGNAERCGGVLPWCGNAGRSRCRGSSKTQTTPAAGFIRRSVSMNRSSRNSMPHKKRLPLPCTVPVFWTEASFVVIRESSTDDINPHKKYKRSHAKMKKTDRSALGGRHGLIWPHVPPRLRPLPPTPRDRYPCCFHRNRNQNRDQGRNPRRRNRCRIQSR